jgi:hypothetical protein
MKNVKTQVRIMCKVCRKDGPCKRRKPQRFNDRQKYFLNERFNVGENTRQKFNPEVVSKLMNSKKNDQSKQMFDVSEYLTTSVEEAEEPDESLQP